MTLPAETSRANVADQRRSTVVVRGYLRATAWSRRTPPSVVVAIVVLGALALFGIFAPMLTDHNPLRGVLTDRMSPPMWLDDGSAEFPLGTDGFGRDVFTRLLFGARISLGVAGLAILFAGALGSLVGIVSGFVGGKLDQVLMRIVDVLLSLPTMLVGIALAVGLGPSFTNVVAVIAVLLWPRIARQIRADTLMIKEQDYARYAGAIGARRPYIMFRHVLPNVVPTLLVMSTLEVGHVILLEASLSFLGAGVPPPTPSWGVMVEDGRALLATGWWISLFPGLAIAMTVWAFNTIGDWLRDRLDPRLKVR